MMIDPIPMAAPGEVYRARRARLAEGLFRPMVLLAGRAPARNYAGNPYPFRPGSTYSYFGGPPVEGAALTIAPGSDGDEHCSLFRPPQAADDEIWMGAAPSDESLAHAAGLDPLRVTGPDRFGARRADRAGGYISPPCARSIEWVTALGVRPANEDELRAVIEMRLTKDEHELDAMRRSAEVAVEAHRAALSTTAPGRGEAEVAAAFGAALAARQSLPSFTPIITVRGEVLHAGGYPNTLSDGALLLADGGAEPPHGYASDVTRTYPVSGSWTPMQRQLYDTVLAAQRAAVAACVPGAEFRDIHDQVAHSLCEGLRQTELLRGDPADLAERRAHTLFFPHGLGHLIGLDVHDMEDFGDLAGYATNRARRKDFGDNALRLDRELAPNMTVTIEPGIYLVPAIWRRDDLVSPFADVVNRPAVDALLKDGFGGIRIEDTVRVCESGTSEVLTAALPSDPDALAKLVGSAPVSNL